jgi:hypothetical protein
LEICVQIRVLWVSQPSVEIVFAEAGSEHGKARLIDKIHQQADMLFLFHVALFGFCHCPKGNRPNHSKACRAG